MSSRIRYIHHISSCVSLIIPYDRDGFFNERFNHEEI